MSGLGAGGERLGSDKFAEVYINRMYNDSTHYRFWAHRKILVGGSINDATDYELLKGRFGITAVLSVESERRDDGKVPSAESYHVQFPDVGFPPTFQQWELIIMSARQAFASADAKLYVHCQAGGSRSPSVAYAIMRSCFGFSPTDALSEIRDFKTTFGDHAFHRTYMDSFECCVAKL